MEDLECPVDQEFKGMKYNGASLKISKLGLFLVNMPCDLLIGKSLLLAIELGCVDEMLDVASIMYSKKPFFVSTDKRQKS
jgi:HrpA-like RNA helicase